MGIKRAVQIMGVFLLAAVVSLAAFAQEELTETFTADDGSFTFDYPQGWETTVNADTGEVELVDQESGISVVFIPPTVINETLPADSRQNAVDALAGYLKAQHEPQGVEVEEIELGERQAARATLDTGDGVEAVVMSVEFGGDAGIGLMLLSGPADAFAEAEPTLLAIAETFGTPGLDLSVLGSISAPEVTCTVSTDQARTASVRVGPGTNRTSIVFLPANQDFDVLGKATADDGSLWWKLDKEAVAPNKSANEVWVAQDDVTAEGECDAVADAAAPPIIPIVVKPPPGSTGEAILPNRGIWTLAFTGNATIVCGGQTFSEPIPGGFEAAVIVGVQQDGAVITLDGSPLNRTQPGTYSGQFEAPLEGQVIPALFTLYVTSPTRMEGNISMTIQGCNATIYVTVTQT